MSKSLNIALIGMAGVGKSHVGENLAKELEYTFVEVDDLIKEEARKADINEDLLTDEDFIELEERVILGLKGLGNCVFVTGGSAVYSEKAMKFLKSVGRVIYLEDSLKNIKERFDARVLSDQSEIPGKIVGLGKKSFKELFEERERLYEKYADVTINVSELKDVQELAKEIIEACPEIHKISSVEKPEFRMLIK